VRGAFDGGIEIEFVGAPLARKFAQAPQRHLDVARAEFQLVVEVLVLALVPTLMARLLRLVFCPMRTPAGL
jgi:hypothetical protein